MKFDFQKMKPILQKDFDDVLASYPTDMSELRSRIPVGGDAYLRKQAILEAAAELCPVRLFRHYPFAYELDMGEVREVCYVGVGNLCQSHSGVDFSPLQSFNALLSQYQLGRFNDYTDHLHRTLDHDKLLAVGFRGVYEECARLNEAETDPHKKQWRELVMTACRTVKTLGLRLRNLAKEQLETETEEDVRYLLQRIVDSVNTPWEPPVTYFDALNMILCTTLFISGLDGVEMNAYGPLDRLLQPYYEQDLTSGRITKEEAYYLLQCFLYKTDFHVHYNKTRKTYDNGVSVMIGGCAPDGTLVYNEITDMIIDAYLENRLINPKLNARASANSPREYLERLTELMLSGGNNLVIENDDYIIPMFQRMGLSAEDARTYVGNGCQEVICRNQLHSRAFTYINMIQILLDTLSASIGGKPLPPELMNIYRYGAFRAENYEQLQESFLANLRSCLRVIAEQFAPYERIQHTINPEPMLSAFTADCISRGQDMTEGGALYYHKTFSFVGFGTLCDSLMRLQEAFESGSIKQLLAAIEANFEGYESLRLSLLNSTDRFGHSAAADAFAKDLANALAQVSRGIINGQGIEWNTSLFTYYTFQTYGKITGATPDGRRAGEPLSRQMNMASLPVLTAAATSMAALTEALFTDVGMFDFSLPYAASDNNNFRQAVTAYVLTCLKLKLPVLQSNMINQKLLTEERDHKGTHPDLVVRICGYSALFTELSRDMQDEIIERLGVGL